MPDTDVLGEDAFSKLTTTMFSAAMGQTSWDYFLDELSRRSGNIGTQLVGFDSDNLETSVQATSGYDPDYLNSFAEHYNEVNVYAPSFAMLPVGVAIDCEAMAPPEEIVKSEFYNDWLRPQEDIIHGSAAFIFKNDTRVFALGANIRRRESEEVKLRWKRLLNRLVPPLQQALEFSFALAGSKLETAMVANHGLRNVPGIVMLSELGRIIYANPRAHAMIAQGQPISTNLSSTLCVGSRSANQQVNNEFLRRNLPSSSPSFAFTLSSDVVGSSYQFRFSKLTPDAQIAFPLDALLGFSEQCTILLISETKTTSDLINTLQTKYHLSQAEAEIVALIAEGLSTRQISDYREVSILTVRSQVKHAMSKLDIHKRVDIVRFVQRINNAPSLLV
ncbi:MAG: helix-turn-helix transcriptional regulator [Rhizobiaceae bacterium]|nr:helix-turn-helix transcriptional regulator [Rhizobiaceae bacterium]